MNYLNYGINVAGVAKVGEATYAGLGLVSRVALAVAKVEVHRAETKKLILKFVFEFGTQNLV